MAEPKKRWSIEGVFRWGEHFSLLREWAWPFVPPAIALVGGYTQSMPIMWIVMATTLTAMGTVVTGAVVVLYLERRDPINKLQHIVVYQMDMTPAPRPEFGNRQQRRAAPKGEVQMLASNQVDQRVPRTID
jgi:hypothetical protein